MAPEIERAGAARPHLAELDGFRAIAVSWVLALHFAYAWPPTLPAAFPATPRLLVEIVSHGWLGVDLFFLLSGFLITGILLDARGTAHYFRDFYARRALRILPLYLVCILLMGLAYRGFGAYFGLSLLFLANFASLFGVSSPHGPGVFWSLAIEEHFYLLWPLLVRFATRATLLAVTLALVLGSPILRGICAFRGMDPEHEIYSWSFFRFDGIALGALIALWARSAWYHRSAAWKLAAALAGISLVVTVAGVPFGIMGTKTVASAALRYTQAQLFFAAALVLALAWRGTAFTAVLRSRVAKSVAGLSYCIYLVHLSLGDGYVAALRALGIDDVARLGPRGAVALRFAVLGALSFGVAALSKRFLEDPMLQLKRYFQPGRAKAPHRPLPAAAPQLARDGSSAF